jgi:peroxiredoxin
LFVVCAALCVVSLRRGEGAGAQNGKLSFTDLSGQVYALKDLQKNKASVFLFFSAQCPISQKYAQRLVKLNEDYSPKGVKVFGVNSNLLESRADVAQYAKEAGLNFVVVKDEGTALADKLGAEITPQAIVLNAQGETRYRGRIDDNTDAEKVTQNYVRDALDAVLAGKPVAPAEVKAVGCAIARNTERKKDGKVTFHRDVLPILQNRCQSCHRPGEIGPFSLMTYDQARAWSPLIKDYTQRRVMPPWKPEPIANLEYLGERRLSDKEIATLAAWADEGAPEGNPKDAPAPRQFTEGWSLGQPDLVLTPEKEFRLDATGRDVYRYFVFPTNFGEDKFVTAIDVRPGNRRIVHHVIAFLDSSGRATQRDGQDGQPGYTSFGGPGFLPAGALGGWAPGNIPRHVPEGIGIALPKGAAVVAQVHYHKSGKEETDKTQIGVYFAKRPVNKRVTVLPVLNFLLQIPPGAERHEVEARGIVPMDVHALSVMPHMHLLGREMKVTATLPDGKEQPLVWVKDWDFNWQDTYSFKEPIALPRGTRLNVTAYYDNSDKNPRNPSKPPKAVRWGEQTTDEMCLLGVQVVADNAADLRQITAMRSARLGGALFGGSPGLDPKAFEDGVPIPERLKGLLGRYDKDGDGKIDDEEIDAMPPALKDRFRQLVPKKD